MMMPTIFVNNYASQFWNIYWLTLIDAVCMWRDDVYGKDFWFTWDRIHLSHCQKFNYVATHQKWTCYFSLIDDGSASTVNYLLLVLFCSEYGLFPKRVIQTRTQFGPVVAEETNDDGICPGRENNIFKMKVRIWQSWPRCHNFHKNYVIYLTVFNSNLTK